MPRSAGLIVAGVHATFQTSLRCTRWTVVAVLHAPTSGQREALGSPGPGPLQPFWLTRPALKVAVLTPSAPNAAALAVVNVAGGVATSLRIAAQSPWLHAVR